MGMLTREEKGRYVSILADGKFHETVPQGTDEAVEREYETSDGKKGAKWELVYTKIEANIVDVSFKDGDFGTNIQLKFRDDEENEVIVSVNTASNFGEDIMKKLPNVDFTKKVNMAPFAFQDEKERNVRGVSIWNDGKKIENFFKIKDTKELLHGFPKPDKDGEGFDKDDWKMYFIQVRKFLIKYTQEHVISKFAEEAVPSKVDYPQDEINPEDVPF